MPPKVKITREKIIETAIEIVRVAGIDALNARGLATALGVSTQPIFSCFSSMSELREEILLRANSIYDDYLRNTVESGKYPTYKSMGMGYIRFAKEERELFKVLFMIPRESGVADNSFGEAVVAIMNYTGLSKDVAERLHFEMWAFVHGVAVMAATDFIDLDEEKISHMMTDIYQGLLTRNKEKCK